MISSTGEAYNLLHQLGASQSLIRHAELVSEVAELLILHLTGLGLELDAQLVRLGCIVHDAGKIVYPEELEKEGQLHTLAGYNLLIEHGVSQQIAHFCLAHADWQDAIPEELMVALADKLWKGKRHPPLEELIIRRISDTTGQDFWTVFMDLDALFETSAEAGPQRLAHSR
ncbi:MAG: HD domain-containing protein [Chloroflexi bacterium]|nr:HD domain-containing protein [Chloroflexota bacterium]